MRTVYWTLGFLALFVLVAGTAAATHYRYGTLSWEPTGNPNEVRFVGGQAWRASAFFGSTPQVGTIVAGEGCIQTGEGCVNFFLRVDAASAVNDWFAGTFVDASGDPNGITWTYSAPNNAGQPWQVQWTSCCRISSISSGNYHVNNPDQSEALRTFIDLTLPPNASPRSTLPPINACPREAFCTIPIPASDSDGDAVTFRMSTASEAGDAGYVPPGPPQAPHAATIGTSTGILSWDTHGATVGASNLHTLYSVQVMLEDDQSQTPLDFFIELLPDGVEPPYWVTPPTPCGETLFAVAGQPLTFDVMAQSDDTARIVFVSSLGLPVGASFPTVTPANPASGPFTWTPTPSQVGQHLVVFAAEDDLGYPAPACPVTIVVNIHPPPTFTAPAECGAPATIHGIHGVPIGFPVAAMTSNASRTVTISLVSGPTGLVFPTTAPGNPSFGFASWPVPYGGAPPAVFRAVDNFGIRATCLVPFDIDVPMGQALTLGAWAGTAVPAAVEYASGGHDLRTVGSDVPYRTSTIATLDHPGLGLHVEGITEWAAIDVGVGTVTSTAGSEIAMASLANGAVVLHGLHQEATIVWNYTSQSQTVTRAAYVDRILVAGQDVVVPAGSTLTVPLPGGYATIFETRDLGNDPGGVSIADNLLHVYLAPSYSRSEIILGSIVLQGGLDRPYLGQARDILAHDDLRTGTDAGATRGSALALAIGVHDANMPAGDAADAFVFQAAHGEKIRFTATPATATYAAGGRLVATGTPPPAFLAPSMSGGPDQTLRASLYDPTGALREESLDLLGVAPARVELNADLTGEWLVVLERASSTSPMNYSIEFTITPVPLLPNADALTLADAPADCVVGDPLIPTVGNGVWPGVVRDDDFADTYRFTAEIGELVAVTLKPGEDADGAAMGLQLYDRDCVLLSEMMVLLDLAKGEPRAVVELPSLYSGDYYARIVRLNGVANHYLDVSVVNPMPTMPMNDALTGADAPDDWQQAVAPPPVLFQGRIHEGDTGDVYRLAYNAGGTAFLGFSMSALSDVDVTLYDPVGNLMFQTLALTDAAIVWTWEPDLPGEYLLFVEPNLAGGNYSVTWGQAPVQAPEP